MTTATCGIAAIRPAGLVLAGGRSTRIGGGDKGLLRLGPTTILESAIAVITPQCATVAISANGDPNRFAMTGLTVIPDPTSGSDGPLAGVLAGLQRLRSNAQDWLLTVPGDTPFLPSDLVVRLSAAAHAAGSRSAVAVSRGRAHPVVALWSRSVLDPVAEAVASGRRKVGELHHILCSASAVWPDGAVDPFFNVNTPADLVEARRLAALAAAARPSSVSASRS